MEYAIILVANNALWLLFLALSEKRKPRYNSKAGQFILDATEDINASAGMVKYHLERAEEYELIAQQERRKAAEKADIMQVRANHAKGGIGK